MRRALRAILAVVFGLLLVLPTLVASAAFGYGMTKALGVPGMVAAVGVGVAWSWVVGSVAIELAIDAAGWVVR